jgi:hypothetical protein
VNGGKIDSGLFEHIAVGQYAAASSATAGPLPGILEKRLGASIEHLQSGRDLVLKLPK